MNRIVCDLCVIGGGSGGLSVAAGAAQMGANVVLIEHGKMGGDCLNYGCVPSKAFIAAARQAETMRRAAPFGIAPVEPQIDFAAVMRHVHRTIEAIAPIDSQKRFEGLGVRVIRETARFVNARELQAGDIRVRARRFVIATGSRPAVPAIDGLSAVPFLTNETVFDLTARPDHLIIIGGGPIGIELAQAFARLGSAVTVIDGNAMLGREDTEMAGIVLDRLQAEGVDLRRRSRVSQISGQGARVSVTLEGGETLSGSHLLVAAGRQPNLEPLDLGKAGVDVDAKGVKVDDRLRSSNRRIFAVGDAAGRLQFTHVANYHAGVVIRQALFGLPARARHDRIPWVTYTDPELARIGLTEAEARERHGGRVEIYRIPLEENDRARTDLAGQGLIKLVAVGGKAVGVTIVGKEAGELIGLWSLAMAKGLTLGAIAGMVLPYPTLGEINKRAAGAYFSPRLFGNPTVSRFVRTVQRVLP